MRYSTLRLALATAVMLAVAPALARAQCSITGPTTFCGATAELCGPSGMQLVWSGPGIVGGSGSCIIVDTAGTYSLQVMDPVTGVWSDPCFFTITKTSGPDATITGPTTGCTGSTVQLCGPSGTLTYQWSGPNGFTATTACVDVGAPGDYTLVVTDATSGCSGASATQTVSFQTCADPPQVPNCPRTAAWWNRAGAGAVPGFDASSYAAVAACVDAHSASLNWAGSADAMRGAMRSHLGDLRVRAARQFAAVVANTCAASAGVPTSVGPVRLDPATPLTLPGSSGTVGDWIAATDAQLASLATHGSNWQSLKESYRDIIRTAWQINHGRGVGPVCPDDSDLTIADHVRAGLGDESLAEELSDDGGLSLVSLGLGQNPARGDANLSLSVAAPTSDVTVAVYDLTGRLVRELAHGSYPAGTFQISWDGRDAHGVAAPNGVYFVQTRIGGQRTQARLTLLR